MQMIKQLKIVYATIINWVQFHPIKQIMIEMYLSQNLYNHEKYTQSNRLNKFEFQVFSQNGEDGIIEEIFRRIGETNKYFVEIGVEDGMESNTTYLLLKGWKGLWLEGSSKFVKKINTTFKSVINSQLKVCCAFITVQNIEEKFIEGGVPTEFDLLSIDIDGNDWHIWNAIKLFNPRVVVIEYNSTIRPNLDWVVKYDSHTVWDNSMHFNSSLKSLEILGKEKGYNLVGCNFTGSNAFFVRENLIKGNFDAPFTAEHHYEPARFFLLKRDGHTRRFDSSTNTNELLKNNF